ncbi:hypothetical protein [Chroococcidiopsis sp.]
MRSQPPVGAGLANMPITATENLHPKPAPPRHAIAIHEGGFDK